MIVFDAGTNDNPNYPEILAGNLQVVTAVGDRCMVVPTIHGFIVDGVDNEGKNQVVREFAASRPGTQMPDWAGVAEPHPELMQADDLHPIAEGADFRAQLIAQGVRACLALDSRFARAERAAASGGYHSTIGRTSMAPPSRAAGIFAARAIAASRSSASNSR